MKAKQKVEKGWLELLIAIPVFCILLLGNSETLKCSVVFQYNIYIFFVRTFSNTCMNSRAENSKEILKLNSLFQNIC